ncbi:unnamed protein product, partial [Phaeothamnion confervicola]
MSTTAAEVPPLPAAPLPPILLSNVPGTWAYDTMSRRLRDDILKRIYDENDMEKSPELKEAKEGLDALIAEMSHPETSKVCLYSVMVFKVARFGASAEEDGGPEVAEWNEVMAPFFGKNWLDAPWLYAEFYAYRRLMEAIGYFKTGGLLAGFDPFANQKMLGVTSALDSMETLSERLLSSPDMTFEAGVSLYLSTALWGNRMDLSLWPVASSGGVVERASEDVFAQILAAGGANLLADATAAVSAVLSKARAAGGARIDVVVDNAGFELFCDLCLADFLIGSGAASEVVLQLKGHPTFVSDAMAKDMMAMVDHLAGLKGREDGHYGAAAAVGERWRGLIASGKWILKEDFFWAQPHPFWEMQWCLRTELSSQSALVVVKGDANYRRLLGDRSWDPTTPFDAVASYFPTRLCALRTLKAEVGCGMAAADVARAKGEDVRWMVSGRWGVIQFFDPF